MTSAATTQDLELLRRTIELAELSKLRGDHPFGALLTDASGKVLLESMNTCGSEGDRTGHAERILMTQASMTYTPEYLSGCTIYSSAEPCAMCAGAIYWSGVGRLVYGLSEKSLKTLIGPHPENLTMDLPCATVLAAGQRSVTISGPLLEEEAEQVHIGFWNTL